MVSIYLYTVSYYKIPSIEILLTIHLYIDIVIWFSDLFYKRFVHMFVGGAHGRHVCKAHVFMHHVCRSVLSRSWLAPKDVISLASSVPVTCLRGTSILSPLLSSLPSNSYQLSLLQDTYNRKQV